MKLKSCGILALVFAGLLGTSPAEIQVQSGQKVAFLGDSITQFGWSNPEGYVHLVTDALEFAGVKIQPLPVGISGNTSRNMLDRVDAQVISRKADWMTLSCGVNDVWHHDATHVDLEPYKANITAIVDKAQAAGIKVVILTATMIQEKDNPDNQALVAYNDFLRQLAKERNLPLADLNTRCWDVLKANPPAPGSTRLTVDGVHMNPDGNMLMARGILEAFGMEKAQIDAFEKKWRSLPDAVGVPANLSLGIQTPVRTSAGGYAKLNEAARQQKISLQQLAGSYQFEALKTVLKAHEADSDLTLTRFQSDKALQSEFQEVYSRKIQEAAK
ncbi:MAG: SGNH/GDSL hydrolase family protein [Chthoniobacteraceae bacterium]